MEELANFLQNTLGRCRKVRVIPNEMNSKLDSQIYAWRLLLIAFLFTIVVLFLHAREFGFYEDDYWGIVPATRMTFSQIEQICVDTWLTWPQGRPLNHMLPPCFGKIGWALGHKDGLYFLGFLVNAVNALLLTLVLRRFVGWWLAVFGGLLFVVFPSDTTKLFLLHCSHVHASMTFLFAGLLLFFAGRWARLLSYPVAAFSLVSYETAYLPFIAFPLFFLGSVKDSVRKGVVHLLFCGGTLAVVMFIRLRLNDARAGSVLSDTHEVVARIFSSLWIGPLTDLACFKRAFAHVFSAHDVFGFALVVLLILSLFFLYRDDPRNAEEKTRSKRDLVQLGLGGLAAWFFSYALTLVNYPPNQEAGRMTSTHTAAAFGVSCVLVALLGSLLARGGIVKKAGLLVFALLLFVLCSYQLNIQKEYGLAWRQESTFWRNVVALCPDIDPGTAILVKGNWPRQEDAILTNSWADLLVLRQVFDWDLSAKGNFANGIDPGNSPVLAFIDVFGSVIHFSSNQNETLWNPMFWGGKSQRLNTDDVIVMENSPTGLRRVDQIAVPGLSFPLKSKRLEPGKSELNGMVLTPYGKMLLGR
jgi:hypothetical protein